MTSYDDGAMRIGGCAALRPRGVCGAIQLAAD
jgi:hypothetical protein